MLDTQVRQLIDSLGDGNAELVETHISWVILSRDHAYKIKKPVKFSFLDFSTQELRHHFCQREVELNNRLTSGIYLGVSDIKESGKAITFDSSEGAVIEHAVRMRRMPAERQMNVLLKNDQVTEKHIEQIADQLSAFHQAAGIPEEPPDPHEMLDDFSDLQQFSEVIHSRYGIEGEKCIRDAVKVAGNFLHLHALRIRERHKLGFVVDGHGDLHSKNIFLLEEPVIFDCIEFNDHLRIVDVLDELAFFCLDLELFGETALAAHFLQYYLQQYHCLLAREDTLLFHYFQLYRAGVKLKINLIKASAADDDASSRFRWENADGYFHLFQQYLEKLKSESGILL